MSFGSEAHTELCLFVILTRSCVSELSDDTELCLSCFFARSCVFRQDTTPCFWRPKTQSCVLTQSMGFEALQSSIFNFFSIMRPSNRVNSQPTNLDLFYALHRKRTANAEIVRHNSVFLNKTQLRAFGRQKHGVVSWRKTQLRAKKQERHNSVTSESSETQLRVKITKRHNSVRFGAKRHNSVTSSEKRHNFVIAS